MTETTTKTITVCFEVVKQRIHCLTKRILVEKSVGFVKFRCAFDDEWDELVKKVVFKNGDTVKEVLLTDNEEPFIPHEVLKTGKLFVSAVGISESGEKKLTTKEMSLPPIVLKAGEQNGETPETYSPELWEQVLAALGDLSKLNTTAKNNLVTALNEVLIRSGGSDDDTGGIVTFDTDETLLFKDGVLSVNTADDASENNTLPITSAAVHTVVGNIEILLGTI